LRLLVWFGVEKVIKATPKLRKERNEIKGKGGNNSGWRVRNQSKATKSRYQLFKFLLYSLIPYNGVCWIHMEE
jgi:hypothetical protein